MFLIFLLVVLSIAALVGIVLAFIDAKGLILTGFAAVLALFLLGVNSITSIPSGTFAVATFLGKIQPGYYAGNGVQFVSPFVELTSFSSKRTVFEIDGQAISSDGNPLTVSVNFPYVPNPNLAWKLLLQIGPDYENTLIKRAAATALRDGINQHTWLEANGMSPVDDGSGGKSLNANLDGRRKVEASILSAWKRTVVEQLKDSSFTETEAENCFDFSDVQLLHATPEQSILNAIALKVAATQELERQRTITKTSAEIALRRSNEGEGYNNLLNAIDAFKGVKLTPEGVSLILQGIAAKENADARLIAIENGKVSGYIISDAPVAIGK